MPNLDVDDLLVTWTQTFCSHVLLMFLVMNKAKIFVSWKRNNKSMWSIPLTWLVPCECVGLTTSPGELTGEYGNLAVGCRVGIDVGDSVAGDVVTGLCVCVYKIWIIKLQIERFEMRKLVDKSNVELHIPNCTDCLSGRVLDQVVCAVGMGNERMSSLATIQCY